jgi:pseudaminic acid biosynthesis-associated methylase
MTSDRKTTSQLDAWRGDFGDAYTERNAPEEPMLRARTVLWAEILRPLLGDPPSSILEVGANMGLNLKALKRLTDARLIAVEPNALARQKLIDDGVVPTEDVHDAFASSIPLADRAVDFAFTSGVLIHIHPDHLLASCREIHRVTRRTIGCLEYFSAEPEEVRYRDRDGLLFKRDFGGFWLDNFPDLRTLECGFAWKRLTGLDNLTWWLFEKRP